LLHGTLAATSSAAAHAWRATNTIALKIAGAKPGLNDSVRSTASSRSCPQHAIAWRK
jgi:hypothetical protein